MYLISYGCAVSIDTPASFRIAWAVQAVPGFILFAALFFFPESPRWLANHDRWEEAHEILANLHAKGDKNNVVVIAELEEVREAVRIAAESKDIGYLGLFAPGIWKRTLVGVSVQVWQQFLGGNVMLYYLVYIFNMAGMVSSFCGLPSGSPSADLICRLETSRSRRPLSNTSSSWLLPESCFPSLTALVVAGYSLLAL